MPRLRGLPTIPWTTAVPVLALVALALTWGGARTVIEVALIVTLMVSGGDETATLARDTVFAAVMISC